MPLKRPRIYSAAEAARMIEDSAVESDEMGELDTDEEELMNEGVDPTVE